MSTVNCQANPDAGADASALMVATLPGRDAGTSALVHGLNRLPGVPASACAAASGLKRGSVRKLGLRNVT